MKVRQETFFLPVDDGECFCVYRLPDAAPIRGTVLHLPAFGDEMNKSRALTARVARSMASRGCGVLHIDLFGCGDSSGEHADATLARWIDNANRAIDWLRDRHATAGTPWLWSLRSGALLIPPLLAGAARDAPLLLWQPIISGAQQLSHLLRQKLVETFADTPGDRSGTRALRERLRRGETLELGGYAISPKLADDFDCAMLCLPSGYCGRIAWLEVVASATPSLSPVARKKIDEFRSAGVQVSATALEGPGFWQSTEIEQCHRLEEASISALTIGETSALSRDPAVI